MHRADYSSRGILLIMCVKKGGDESACAASELCCNRTVATLLINLDWRTNLINMKFVYGNYFSCTAITGVPTRCAQRL
jgi:hypothetical protein